MKKIISTLSALVILYTGCSTLPIISNSASEHLSAKVKRASGCENGFCNILSSRHYIEVQQGNNPPVVFMSFHFYESPSVRVGDFNKDGHLDLKVSVAYPANGYRDSSSTIFYGDGKGNFSENN